MLELDGLRVRIASEEEAQILFSALLRIYPQTRWNYQDKTSELREPQLGKRSYVGFHSYSQGPVLSIHQSFPDPSIISLQELLARLEGTPLPLTDEPATWTPQVGEKVIICERALKSGRPAPATITAITTECFRPCYTVEFQDGTKTVFHLAALIRLTQQSTSSTPQLSCPRCSGDFSIPYPKPCCPVCGAPGTFIPGKEPKKPLSTLGKKFSCQHTHLQEMMSGKFKCLSPKCRIELLTTPIDYIPRLISWRNHTTTVTVLKSAETCSDEKGACCSDHKRAQ